MENTKNKNTNIINDEINPEVIQVALSNANQDIQEEAAQNRGVSHEVEPEVDEYDVEGVIQKQETHNLFCPNCNACITKRVILKRKTNDEPETDEHAKGGAACFDAISCFSCFSIFIPKGDGFLCWRFKPNPAVTLQAGDRDDPSAVSMNPAAKPIKDETGTVFPSWILTCCQPYHTEKPDTSVDSEFQSSIISDSESSESPGRGKDCTLWNIVTCCQPSADRTNTEHLLSAEPPLVTNPSTSINPENCFPYWLVTCCQPGRNHLEMPEDVTVDIPQSESISQSFIESSHEPPRHRRVSGVDIIKAIVYGGLLECISSLSVITSAAGGDATTLNIVALGLANVFAGLGLLLHNLRVLKHEHTTERYEDQLGRPGHWLLHAVVAITSYLVFGLMSPIIYGFTFRKSDNKDYKLATLAAASLVCITFLSVGKAYTRRPPKAYIQTIVYYFSMGFMVSGAGYVAGNLINTLLKELGVFASKASVAMNVPEAGVNGAWTSY